MGEKETGDPASNLNLSKSNRTAGGDPDGGAPPDDTERRIKPGATSYGTARVAGEGEAGGAARLSTNMTVERQTPKRDFGD
ncbi:MAG: hypothetical protein ABI782_07885 [Anaerolineaceae bacterium]